MLSSAIYSSGFVGHEAQLARLASLVEGRRVPHGLIFSGLGGVGKFLAAKWVSAAYLCDRSGCGECSTCTRVLRDLHPDVHVMRAEEGRRDIAISQVRTLSQAVATKPFEAEGKAAIIDDADRMNEESQNAFLKTLEEPPARTLIILVTASPERLLPTIRSRCQRFRFGPLRSEELARFLDGQPDLELDFPESLSEGSPGRLLALVEAEAGHARRIFIDFIACPSLPSPVKAAGELMEWAMAQGATRQDLRECLRLALGLGAGILRDLAFLMEGAEDRQLVNRDLESPLREAMRNYGLKAVFDAHQQLVEASADVAGYVDAGLVAEHVFRFLRETRKRG